MGRAMIGSKTNTIIVQAFNSRSENEFEKSAKLEIKESAKSKDTAPDLVWGSSYTDYRTVCDPTDGKDNLNPYKNCDARAQESGFGSGDDRSVSFYTVAVDGASISVRNPVDFGITYGLSTKIGSASAAPLAEGRIFFTRAMKMNDIPTADVSCDKIDAADKKLCDRLELKFKWLNEQNLSVIISVKAGDKITGTGEVLDAMFKIRNLKGANDKAFASKYPPSAYEALNTLNLRFQTTAPNPCALDAFNAANSCNEAEKKDYCVANGWNTTPGCNIFTYCQLFPTDATECGEVFYDGFELGYFSKFSMYSSEGGNLWIVGDEEVYGGNYSAYISNDGSSYEYDYTDDSESSIHSYAFNFPNRTKNTANYNLSFDWMGEGGTKDYMIVCLVPEWYYNNYGTSYDCNGDGYRIGSNYNNQSVWTTETISLPFSNYNNNYDNYDNYVLIFQWINTYLGITSGIPAAIDNIVIK
jgi:hypothetical protein